MQTFPTNSGLPSARDHLVRALAILDDSAETVIAARVADAIDLLNARLTASGS